MMDQNQINFTPRAQKIVKDAKLEAFKLNKSTADLEHLFLAFLNIEDSQEIFQLSFRGDAAPPFGAGLGAGFAAGFAIALTNIGGGASNWSSVACALRVERSRT